MDKVSIILTAKIFGNTLEGYCSSLAILLGAVLLLKKCGKFSLCRLKTVTQKTAIKWDDFVLEVFEKNIYPVLYFGAFYFALKQLTLHPSIDKLVNAVMVTALTIQGLRLLVTCSVYFLEHAWLKREIKKGETAASKSIVTLVRLLIWGFGFVFLLDNLGFDVSAVVAGLGIGGIAVALAAQTILGDLFNYFVILFDKPFREGDFIVTGDFMGEIEDIGIKSTRIRALGGEELIVSNSNLTSSRIRNYKRMSRRRVEFTLRVGHQTTLEQLKKIPRMIQEIIQGIDSAKFDRTHFKGFAESGLAIETVYYVLDADFSKHMDVQHGINLAIKESFEKEGIRFV